MIPTAAQLKGLLLTGVLIILSMACTRAADIDNALWQKGNQLYQQKEYDSALVCFEKVAATHSGVAEVYYNIGNTYYKLNKVAPAVLNYERALRINPDYKQASDNLALTQNRISNHIPTTEDIFFISWWRSATKPSLANMWAVLTLATFVVLILVISVRRFKISGGASIPVQVSGLMVVVFIFMLTLAIGAASNAINKDMAVVMQNDVPLMNENMKGKPLSLIPEGTTVRIKNSKPGYMEVTLPDGRSGWVQEDVLTKI